MKSVATASGRRVIGTIYVAVVLIAALFGFLVGTIATGALRPPRLFFLVELPPSPVGMATYGAITVATILGVLLLLVEYVSRHYVDGGDRDGVSDAK